MKIFQSCQFIFTIFQLSPIGKGHGPSFEQICSFTQECFVPNLIGFGQVVWYNKIFVIFFPISKLSPFWKGCVPKFDQTWIPFTQVCFLRSLVEIGLVVLKKRIFLSCQFIFTKKMKMWKVYRQRDGRTMDARRSEKLTWAFSSGELKMNPNIIRTLHQICLSPCFYKRRV